MPTLREVAGLAGVSVATVSNVVNNTKPAAAYATVTAGSGTTSRWYASARASG